MADSILSVPTSQKIRSELEDLIIKDLHGPFYGEEEELDEGRVHNRYILGVLAPRNQTSDEQMPADELATAGSDTPEDGKAELSTPAGRTLFPSSMGMTFSVDGSVTELFVDAEWGRYERIESESLTKYDGKPKRIWKRVPVKETVGPIAIAPGTIPPMVISYQQPEVKIQGIVRRYQDIWIISLFMVNNQMEPEKLKDIAWLYQVEFSVRDRDNRPIFCKRAIRKEMGKCDPDEYQEELMMDMLYREHVEFAVGHGVGVHVEVDSDNSQRAVKISTRSMPSYELPKTIPPRQDEFPGLVLDMKILSESENPVGLLKPLLTEYRTWIDEQRTRTGEPKNHLQEHGYSAETAMKKCEEALERIREGMELLEKDNVALEAFRFMNRSMHLQRIHTILSEKTRRGEDPAMNLIDIPENRTWYPFQIAFILINIPALTDLHHKDRVEDEKSIADLLWFPTGGGKTEAYLGVASYTMAIRRLQKDVHGRVGEKGMAVLMRYTLRLLTLQQFQRATALMCAQEIIRREAPEKWGKAPFRLGLWVGMKTTPNTNAQSEEAAAELRRNDSYKSSQAGGRGSPAQLTNCPWCGKEIKGGKNIRVDKDLKRTLIYCSDPLGICPFSAALSPNEGLPVLLVDEEIYRHAPAMLIATVDKFAQMPWKGEVQVLFGRIQRMCERHGFRTADMEDTDKHNPKGKLPAAKTVPHLPLRPPDLIIQDELHLISGPLGSLVGLYETALDRLCSWEVEGKTVRPKVIASTATIRRAGDQVYSLFLHDVRQFPPNGLDIGDNFFSRQIDPSEENPGRRYLGLCAPGLRMKEILIRVYVASMSAAQMLFDKYGQHADPWMTMVGYFNALRELGGMRRLVDDQVRTWLVKMDKRGLATRFVNPHTVEELTSRKGATDIPEILDQLELSFTTKSKVTKKVKKNSKVPLDVLLATNMISVGVDVSRLGLMAVTGQPKNTAEYIQATSRIGRRHPGLVLMVYNWARPRDLSHYEHFEHYHETFYRQVEALSVTPFAARAMDKGLSALLVSLVRLAGEKFNGNAGAAEIDRDHPYVKEAIDNIVSRAVRVLEDNTPATYNAISSELKNRLDVWLSKAQDPSGGSVIGYKTARDGKTLGLLKRAENNVWEKFTCLNSLRDVEPSVNLILKT